MEQQFLLHVHGDENAPTVALLRLTTETAWGLLEKLDAWRRIKDSEACLKNLDRGVFYGPIFVEFLEDIPPNLDEELVEQALDDGVAPVHSSPAAAALSPIAVEDEMLTRTDCHRMLLDEGQVEWRAYHKHTDGQFCTVDVTRPLLQAVAAGTWVTRGMIQEGLLYRELASSASAPPAMTAAGRA